MRSFAVIPVCTLIATVAATCIAHDCQADDEARNKFFETRIRPVLVEHCFSCHSQKSEELQGDLYLDRQLTKNAPLIVPGDPDKSVLIDAIRYTNSDLQMPPSKRLSANVIADFERWVKDGAFDPRPESGAKKHVAKTGRTIDLDKGRQFWAFQPVRGHAPPEVTGPDRAWIQSPIDAFIVKRLQKAGLRPSAVADRRTLIRRATFILTGLPPKPDDVARFIADRRPDAFARLVDELLKSPAYGERWGRHWLDVVRYGDCNGADESRPFPNAWNFRNYIIESFNRDLPYDRMIAEHLAGDLLEHDGVSNYEPLVGTGFLVLGTKILAEQDSQKMQVDIIDEQIDAFSRSMLAMTVACARCHDHKFDPIPTSDYYALSGIFNSTKTMSGYGTWMVRPSHNRESIIVARQLAPRLTSLQAELKKLREKVTQQFNGANGVTREAEAFDRGTVHIETTNYGKGIGIVGNRPDGKPFYAEYDIEVPEAAPYLLQFRYAAAQSRPGKLSLNGKVVVEAATAKVSGGWFPEHQRWFTETTLMLNKGVNTLRFDGTSTVMVHLDKLRVARLAQGASLTKAIEQRDALAAKITSLQNRAKPPHTVMAVTEGKIADTQVHIRGSHLRLGEDVPRGFLKVIAGTRQQALPKDQSGRLQLARWMARPDHPLTSRVMVNRIWRWHFGRGIVATPDNFGLQGERPTHPELLDYLARRFVEKNWSIKAMHREIMLSSAWQMAGEQASSSNLGAADPNTVDPENRLYWKASPRRLEAEAIRDALLAVSNRLDSQVGGAPLSIKTIALSPEDLEKQQKYYDESSRRSVYLPVLRTNVYDFFTLFDFANPDFPTGNRVTTTVPTQALLMMNSPLVGESAKRLAVQLLNDQGQGAAEKRVESAYLILFSRPPTSKEAKACLSFVESYSKALGSTGQANQVESWTALMRTLIASNEFVYLR